MKQLTHNVESVLPMRRISDSVVDTLDGGTHTQNVEVFEVSTVSGVANGTNVTRAFYGPFSGNKAWTDNDTNIRVFDTSGNELTRTNSAAYDNVSEVGKYYIMSNQYIYFIVALGTTKEQADAALAGYDIYYQLNSATVTALDFMPNLSKSVGRVALEYDVNYE